MTDFVELTPPDLRTDESRTAQSHLHIIAARIKLDQWPSGAQITVQMISDKFYLTQSESSNVLRLLTQEGILELREGKYHLR